MRIPLSPASWWSRLSCVLVGALACASCVPPAARVSTVTELAPPAPAPRADLPRRNLPISGGTLRIRRDGRLAAVSDPDADRVWLVELDRMRVRAEVTLEPGDEPGRIVEDLGQRFHVVLRRGGAIVTLDEHGRVLLRRDVCPSPRGIDLDPSGDRIHVACAGGELVTLGIFDRAPTRTLFLPPDLRDVIATHDRLHVSRFRAAEVLTVDERGNVAVRHPRPWDLDALLRTDASERPRRDYEARVAWRIVKDPRTERVWMIHQRAARFPVDLEVPEEPPRFIGYGGAAPRFGIRCKPGISHSAITPLDAMASESDEAPTVEAALSVLDRFRLAAAHDAGGPILDGGVLPVDVAFAPDGAHVAMAFPASTTRQLAVARTPDLLGACTTSLWEPGIATPHAFAQPVAVAWIDAERVAVQYRQPHGLVVYTLHGRDDGRYVELGERAPRDRGSDVFHEATPAQLACATCHPEGGDDGHVWDLGHFGGERRTQTLHGGVASAPFHWAGDLASLDALVDEVFVERMGGRRLRTIEVEALGAFLAAMPPAPRAAIRDPEAIDRGRALFVQTGCERCHRGARFSDDLNHDVGTGGSLQTPTLLGLTTRPPYMHDGRASTLRERFTDGHTPGHGDLGSLAARELDDLTAYLASL